MAVKVMQGITRYIGTAAEIAAYDIAKANIGSTFFESDTGIVNQAGVLVNAPSESVSLSGSIASEYEALTIDNTAGGIACTAAKYTGCRRAFMTLETAQIRFTIDGTAPTTTVGHILDIGDILKLDSAEDIAAFRAIRTGGTSGSLRCTYSA
jgi:CO dehydrogenase/acetyl-CoA synthase alpha subunit